MHVIMFVLLAFPVPLKMMRNFAHCNIDGCKHITKIDNGTGGLISHLKSDHRPVYDAMMGIGVSNQTPSPFPPPVSARASSDGSVFISKYAKDNNVGYKPKSIHDFFLQRSRPKP